MKQEQFLDVVDERTARARFDAACAALSTSSERVPLATALGRVLAEDVASPVDVPGFDRSDVDGFAVRAEDTYGAEELSPRRLRVANVRLAAGATPPADLEVRPGEAVQIATGAVVPRGADAVVMVEHTRVRCDEGDGGSEDGGDAIDVTHAVAPGGHVSFAGSDLGRGEIVLRSRTLLTSRETAMLAAIGVGEVAVLRQPVVGVLSTGDEIRAPGTPLPLAVGALFDSNQRAIADAAREQGCDVRELGILPDDIDALRDRIRGIVAARSCDVLLLSGGTSKGAGDLNYRVVADLAAEFAAAGRADSPGIVVHGVALKPGKPLCLAVVAGVPVVILPGFPTSAIFTFHEFVAPLLRRLAGRRDDAQTVVRATLPLRIQSAVGRTDYQLVNLIDGPRGLTAYPLGAGSGSVSAFARADGFLRVPQEVEVVAEGAEVEVRLLGRGGRAADLVAIGSHCIGLDRLLSVLAARGLAVKSIAVGSQGGLNALARGEGDVAGTHLLDAATGVYNRAFLPPGTRLLPGYARRQGLVFRRGDKRFEGADIATFLARAVRSGVRMIHRNKGSGTRVLLDGLLAAHAPGAVPDGFAHQAKSHHAVAAAVAQGRADWGMTLDTLATDSDLGFLFVRDESFDFAVRDDRWDRPGVIALRDLLASDEGRSILRGLGFVPTER